jgi:hypothetical protein
MQTEFTLRDRIRSQNNRIDDESGGNELRRIWNALTGVNIYWQQKDLTLNECNL